MEVKLVSHINADEDLLPAWFQHYARLGVTSFHIIVHGSKEENAVLFEMAERFPVVIENIYEGEFKSEEKKNQLQACLNSLCNNWILLVDSDEFVELPYKALETTIHKLIKAGANALYAPMLQRIKTDGSIDTPEIIEDPFEYFPLCSVDLYEKLGVHASISKYPLFYCFDKTLITEGGNHTPPNKFDTLLSGMRGVTHHFKWKKSAIKRLNRRAKSTHTFRHESIQYLQYLEQNNNLLPTEGAFLYSRKELIERGLLRRRTKLSRDPEWDFEENFLWLKNIKSFFETVSNYIAEGETFVLVDENQFDFEALNITCVRFIEKDGVYWGAPVNDEVAINELERLRQTEIGFIVFAPQCFWWLEHYHKLKSYLFSNYKNVLDNDRIKIFDLRLNTVV